jgi:hypothetical protein
MSGAGTRYAPEAVSEQMRGGLAGLREERSAEESAESVARLFGRTEPRWFPEPLRPLTRKTTRGYELIDFARNVMGEPFDPWQEWLAIHALELNPDGTYRFRIVLVLVARQNGKTHFLRTLTLWRMYMDGARKSLGCAQDLDLAREFLEECVETINGVPDLAAEFGGEMKGNGRQCFWLTNGAQYKITAANRKAGRGKTIDQMNMDEIREQRDFAAWSALSKTTSARAFSQIWAITNAGDDESVVLNQLRDAALSGRDESIGLFEWSGPEGCELDDWDAILQANPGIGYNGPTVQAIKTALTSDPPNVFRTEVLCQKVDALDSAVDGGAWQSCKDTVGQFDFAKQRIVACIDVAPDGAHVTLAGAVELADGRVRVEVLKSWKNTADARKELPDVLRKVKPAAVGWFPGGPAAAIGVTLRKIDVNKKPIKIVDITGQDVNEACQEFADLAKALQILHPNDPLLNGHVAGSKKLRVGDGWRFVRRGVGHVDAAYAGAGAAYVVRTLPVEVPKPRSSVV